ncbi:MAG: hypothetical protein RBR30_13755 [Tenuifilaceae bacterium]|nr:hypothetical protein [Tenuifilaceae bacterium]
MPKADKPNKFTASISISEFTDVFLGIDDQILQLHQCSSDDFLGLNADFKQYYRQAKAISDNATQIFNALTESETNTLLRDLETLYKDLKQIQLQFANHLNQTIGFLREIMELQGKLFLPVKNMNQDLLTLKFLLANIKISNSNLGKAELNNLEKLLHRYNEVINDFKICGYQNESNLELLKGIVSRSLKQFESISDKHLQDLEEILNNIHYGIILFAEKHEEVARQIPELTHKTENSSKSIADIITNLQYHDIIRQKMEHVQATHKRLLGDLENTALDGKDALDQDQKLLVRIRDIANLQSAQLVYANKEYQQAIEVITSKFIAISNDMTNIASMCKEINLSQANSDELYLQNLIDKMQSSSHVLNKFLEASQSFHEHIDELTSKIVGANDSVGKFSKSLKSLRGITGETIEALSGNEGESKELSETLKQVQNLYTDVEKFEGEIQQVFGKIAGIGSKLLPDIGETLKGAISDGLFVQAATSMTNIINQLNQKHITIKALLDQNLAASKSVAVDVRESISKIRYYDFFEKVIVDIIAEFNHIYQMLRTELNEVEKADDLEAIKNLYTMASEHKIHDKVSGADGDVDLFSDDEAAADDDNLELF